MRARRYAVSVDPFKPRPETSFRNSETALTGLSASWLTRMRERIALGILRRAKRRAERAERLALKIAPWLGERD